MINKNELLAVIARQLHIAKHGYIYGFDAQKDNYKVQSENILNAVMQNISIQLMNNSNDDSTKSST